MGETSVEEYVEGEEFTYDTLCVGGVPVYENVAQYLPKPLEARSEEWISPVIITVRDLSQPKIQKGIALGRQVLKALNMGDGFTHMEWFRTPEGEAVVGEIAARAPGAKLVDQMNWANDFDVFRGWAQAVTGATFEEQPSRAWHAAVVFKRAAGRGAITRIEGIDAVRHAIGAHIVEDALLPLGHPRRDWRSTLLSDGWIALRHPELELCRAMMDTVVRDVRMFAG